MNLLSVSMYKRNTLAGDSLWSDNSFSHLEIAFVNL